MRARTLLLLALLGGALALMPVPAAAGPAPAPPPAAGGPRWGPPMHGDLSVTRPFEPLPHPFAAGHRGADLPGTPWSPVLAAGDGVVVFAGMVAGRPVVSVDHAGGLRTTYEPVDPSVAAGQPVTRGSPLGTLAAGHAGCPVQACLHWGLRRGETYLDPMELLRPTRVRLLPRAGDGRPLAGRAP
ncbi:M23 family metallopeptidase [Blastococcus deserti]|uniref:M23 family metallopeptidase n=1 Tax=Blastococcus deserti TaxID=2259033 RepID=A0ABW4X7K6_9ACTN